MNLRCRWQNHNETGECRFDCFDPVLDMDPVIEGIARDSRLKDLVGSLYGEPLPEMTEQPGAAAPSATIKLLEQPAPR